MRRKVEAATALAIARAAPIAVKSTDPGLQSSAEKEASRYQEEDSLQAVAAEHHNHCFGRSMEAGKERRQSDRTLAWRSG